MGKKKSASRRKPDYQVFVSHATADKWLATTICHRLEEVAKATTFRDDRDIGGGDDIPDSIRRELKASSELLVLLTPESVNRPWVLLEVGAFWGRTRNQRIVTVLCHVNFDMIPEMLKSKKSVLLNQFDDYLVELAKRVEEMRS